MAHRHDEQRLNELLREIAQEDRRAGPDAELQRRVMARWDGPSSIVDRPSSIVDRLPAVAPCAKAGPSLARRSGLREGGSSGHRRLAIGGIAYWAICGIAAALLIAIAIPRTPLADIAFGTTAVTTTTPAASTMGSTVGSFTPSTAVPTVNSASVSTTRRRAARRTAPHAAPAQSEAETIEFVPLVPMTAQELSGSFQIIRVQMPRASLGALGSTLDVSGAGELVETDVLLGEDGMARAIRVSTNETTYPWRSR